MTLAKNTNFTTEDPDQLRTDLQLEHRDIVREFERVGDPMPRWTVFLVGEGAVVRAQPNGLYIGAGITVYAPGKAASGTVFRVCEVTTTVSSNVVTDDGSLIQGVAPPFVVGGGQRGWFEFVYVSSLLNPALSGWWGNR
jgi:hypothetical protein